MHQQIHFLLEQLTWAFTSELLTLCTQDLHPQNYFVNQWVTCRSLYLDRLLPPSTRSVVPFDISGLSSYSPSYRFGGNSWSQVETLIGWWLEPPLLLLIWGPLWTITGTTPPPPPLGGWWGMHFEHGQSINITPYIGILGKRWRCIWSFSSGAEEMTLPALHLFSQSLPEEWNIRLHGQKRISTSHSFKVNGLLDDADFDVFS